MNPIDKLKHDISVVILEYLSEKADIPFDDYCEIYDSETHEKALCKIMKIIMSFKGEVEE